MVTLHLKLSNSNLKSSNVNVKHQISKNMFLLNSELYTLNTDISTEILVTVDGTIFHWYDQTNGEDTDQVTEIASMMISRFDDVTVDALVANGCFTDTVPVSVASKNTNREYLTEVFITMIRQCPDMIFAFVRRLHQHDDVDASDWHLRLFIRQIITAVGGSFLIGDIRAESVSIVDYVKSCPGLNDKLYDNYDDVRGLFRYTLDSTSHRQFMSSIEQFNKVNSGFIEFIYTDNHFADFNNRIDFTTNVAIVMSEHHKTKFRDIYYHAVNDDPKEIVTKICSLIHLYVVDIHQNFDFANEFAIVKHPTAYEVTYIIAVAIGVFIVGKLVGF